MSQQGINVGSIYADLNINTGNLDRGLAAGRQALAAIDREVKQLTSDLNTGAIGLMEYTARTNVLAQTQRELAEYMRDAYVATQTLDTGLELVTRNANSMVHATNRMGQGLMQLGYIADDIQYGFSGVVNNIAPLVYGLGGSGGVATAAQVAAVAVYQLYTHWDQFAELIGAGTVRTEAEEMERLANATSRTADEQEWLNKHKEEEKRIQQMLSGRSQEAIATEKAVQDIYDEAGPRKIAGTLAAQMKRPIMPDEQKHLDYLDARRERLIKESKAMGVNPYESGLVQGLEFQRADAEKNIEKARQDEAIKAASRLMDRARQADAEGEQARQSIISKLSTPKNELYSVAMALGSAGPEAQKRAKKAQALADEKQKKEKEDAAEAKKKEMEDKREAEAKDRDREKELGRMGYLEERAGKGLNTKGENAELVRLMAADAERQRREDEQEQRKLDADRKKELGPIGFLEEQATKRKLTPGEQAELGRLKEAKEKKDKQEAKHAENEAKQAQRDNMAEAKKVAPGIEDQSEFLAMKVMGGAMTPSQALGEIEKALRDNGMDAAKVVDTAEGLLAEADVDVREGVVKRLLGGHGEKTKNSDVFDASTLAARMQSSVGGERQKELSVLEGIRKGIDDMVHANVVRLHFE